MRDTTPEFERFVAAQYRRLTAAERVCLCTEMFDAARVLVESGLPPGLGDGERRRRITARFYGTEFANRMFPTGSRGAQAALDALKRAIALEVAARYNADEIRRRSAANLARWKRCGAWSSAYGEWDDIVSSNDDGRLYAAMLGQDERANRLRQSMPFVGMLPEGVLERLRQEAAR